MPISDDIKQRPLTVRYLPISAITPAPANARTHSPDQIQQISRSIQEFGWTNPILVDEANTIIAGHSRLAAASKAGLSEVPTILLTGLSDRQKRALVIADNKLALNAGWDEDILRVELGALKDLDFDISLIGFNVGELAALLDTTAGLVDPNDAPEPQADAVSVLGDVWLLGRHRLVCGDCTDAGVVGVALGGAKPHLMVTDPPYGVDYDPAWRNDPKLVGKIHGGGRSDGPVRNDDRSDWSEAWKLFSGDVVYCWCGQVQVIDLGQRLVDCGFLPRNLIVWAKANHVLTRGHYHSQQETCWYAVRKGGTAHWHGDRSQTTLWRVDRTISNETGHSTQKPVECMKRPIENNSQPGDAVYEPFSGSGTTIIAAEMTGRACHAIEIEPRYVDVAIRRWQTFTGKQAILERTGEPFDALTAPAEKAA